MRAPFSRAPPLHQQRRLGCLAAAQVRPTPPDRQGRRSVLPSERAGPISNQLAVSHEAREHVGRRAWAGKVGCPWIVRTRGRGGLPWRQSGLGRSHGRGAASSGCSVPGAVSVAAVTSATQAVRRAVRRGRLGVDTSKIDHLRPASEGALESLKARPVAQWHLGSVEGGLQPMAATRRAGSHELRHHEGGRFNRLARRGTAASRRGRPTRRRAPWRSARAARRPTRASPPVG